MNKLVLKPGTVRSVHQQASSFLKKNNKNPQEALWLIQDMYDWSLTDFHRQSEKIIDEEKLTLLQSQFNQLSAGLPYQYVSGSVSFLGDEYLVTPDVLIPRPETEEWMQRALAELKNSSDELQVLDLGTGSGVIAISHALARPSDEVWATDISAEALNVARQNSSRLNAQVHFKQSDVFQEIPLKRFQVIYSNPPYIAESERSEMTQNVLDYEPETALFADEEGLSFYIDLAHEIKQWIAPSGFHLFLEIGYKQRSAVSHLMREALPGSQIKCWQDFNGLDRVIHVWSGALS